MKKLFLLFSTTAFLCSVPVKAQNKIELNQLNLNLMTTEYGSIRANRSCENRPLTINGKTYTGVGTHAYSKMIVSLQGKAQSFQALVGVDDEVSSRASVVFRISGDNKILAESPVMRKGNGPFFLQADLKGINQAVLEVLPTEDGNNNDHADWAEAYFTMNDGTAAVAIPDAELIELTTENTQLTFCMDKKKNLFQQYLGSRGGLDKVFQNGMQRFQAYPTIRSHSDFAYWGEPALHVIHHDGHMSTQLHFESKEVKTLNENVTLTRIRMKDPNYDFYTDLCYKIYKKENVIEQWAEIYHQEPDAIVVKNMASAALTLPAGNHWLTQFHGGWADEFNVTESPLTIGQKIIDNKWGITSSNEKQQHFMISLDGKPQENQGEVLAGTLAWSGNYRLLFEKDNSGNLTVQAGINPWASDYTLPRGERFTTPALIYTFSSKGKGEASRNLHRWARNYGIRDGHKLLRTIFNNWEATGMNTADKVIIPFLKPAAKLGFELFLLDDGWFGLPDKARVLGEWNPSPQMHPEGMKNLIQAVGKTGIDFGLWVEMEMANPDARLVTEHPEWLLCEPQREKHLQRGQYVLDLSNPEVQNFCIESFDHILKQNPGISFVKWDCNSPFHNPYSHYLGKNQEHLWIKYTEGLYRVFEESVRRNPDLQMMLCSAGGARNDYGALRYFHEFWTSDNTIPMSRVFIQWGTSHIFPAKVQGAHVTHMGNQPFKFAFDVAMSGCLGMDANPVTMSKEDQEITRRAVKVYKDKIRPVVQLGDLYRLVSPYETSRSVVSFVEEDKKEHAVVFCYQVKDDTEGITVKLEGLDPNIHYQVEEVNIDKAEEASCQQNGEILSGKELMEKGLSFACKKKFDSASVYLSVQE